MAGFPGTPATPFTFPARNGPIMRHFISEYREGGMSCALATPEAKIPKDGRNAREATTSMTSLTLRASPYFMVCHPHRRRPMEPRPALCLDQLGSGRLSLIRHLRRGCPVL